MKLSIIIPVYNAEKYLKKCLESVFVQEIPLGDYEVIAVDDGIKQHTVEAINHAKDA